VVRISGLALKQEIVEYLGIRLRRQGLTPCRRQLNNPVPSLRSFHDATQRRDLFEESRHNAIGPDHKILDQIRGMITHLFCDVHHLLVQHYRKDFIRINIQCPVWLVGAWFSPFQPRFWPTADICCQNPNFVAWEDTQTAINHLDFFNSHCIISAASL